MIPQTISGAVAARREKPTLVFKNKADADNSSIEKARAHAIWRNANVRPVLLKR